MPESYFIKQYNEKGVRPVFIDIIKNRLTPGGICAKYGFSPYEAESFKKDVQYFKLDLDKMIEKYCERPAVILTQSGTVDKGEAFTDINFLKAVVDERFVYQCKNVTLGYKYGFDKKDYNFIFYVHPESSEYYHDRCLLLHENAIRKLIELIKKQPKDKQESIKKVCYGLFDAEKRLNLLKNMDKEEESPAKIVTIVNETKGLSSRKETKFSERADYPVDYQKVIVDYVNYTDDVEGAAERFGVPKKKVIEYMNKKYEDSIYESMSSQQLDEFLYESRLIDTEIKKGSSLKAVANKFNHSLNYIQNSQKVYSMLKESYEKGISEGMRRASNQRY